MTTARQAAQARRNLDRRLAALGPESRYAAPRAGWLRAIREALGMSASVLGRRLGVSAQAVRAMETSELEGRVRLDTLRRAADAMECVVVYALIPKASLESLVQRQAALVAEVQLTATVHSMALEDQAAEVDAQAVQRHAGEILAAGRQWRDGL
jgi:predicted DNA-binding mobile mystery protein A